MNKKIKILVLIIGIIILYYGLQYISTAIYFNNNILKDDGPPPIKLPGELIYRVIVQPPWLDQFKIDPMTFYFKDGQFNFWEGKIEGKTVVIRVREGDSPVMYWIGSGLPLGIPIQPANGEHIKEWLQNHLEYELSY